MPHILIVAPNWIGDALMAQPLLMRLREKNPGVEIDVLAPEWVAPVVRRMAEVEDVIAAPFRHKALQLRQRWKIARDLEARAATRRSCCRTAGSRRCCFFRRHPRQGRLPRANHATGS